MPSKILFPIEDPGTFGVEDHYGIELATSNDPLDLAPSRRRSPGLREHLQFIHLVLCVG